MLRATWNYPQQPARFLAWVEAISRRTSVWNPLSVVRWNHHKGWIDGELTHAMRKSPRFSGGSEAVECVKDVSSEERALALAAAAAFAHSERALERMVDGALERVRRA